MVHVPKEAHQPFEQIVIENGYKVETHWVTTEDGYINHMFRIYKDSPTKNVNGT